MVNQTKLIKQAPKLQPLGRDTKKVGDAEATNLEQARKWMARSDLAKLLPGKNDDRLKEILDDYWKKILPVMLKLRKPSDL